jgi:hypothetical protein
LGREGGPIVGWRLTRTWCRRSDGLKCRISEYERCDGIVMIFMLLVPFVLQLGIDARAKKAVLGLEGAAQRSENSSQPSIIIR